MKTGARDETDAEWGVSHFLEHMVFKGTDDLSADEINRRFDSVLPILAPRGEHETR